MFLKHFYKSLTIIYSQFCYKRLFIRIQQINKNITFKFLFQYDPIQKNIKKKQKNQRMQSVIQILDKHGILSQTIISGSQYFLVEKRPNREPHCLERIKYKLLCPFNTPGQKLQQINEQIQKIDNQIVLVKQLGACPGEKIPQYKNLHKVYTQQRCDLIHKKGQVLLIDVWATWCGPCQLPMKHNQQMLEKNQQTWKNQVRIVAVSVDQQKQTIKDSISSQGWNKIQHLTFLGWDNNHPLINDFKIEGIPFVCLVDKFRNIRYTGHPSHINLQQKINQLIAQNQQIIINTQQQKKDQISQNSIAQLVSQLQKLSQIRKIFTKQLLIQKFGKAQLFSAQAKTNNIKIQNKKIQKYKFEIKVCTYEQDRQYLDEFKQLLIKFDPQLYDLELKVIQCQKVPNVQNPQCIECKSKLSYPFYWCKWDQTPNSFRCRQCIEKKPETGHYNYLNNSILLNEQWDKIPIKGFGNNIQPENISNVQNYHYFGCNGQCELGIQNIGQARYVCLDCRSEPNSRGDYIDFCANCMQKYLKGDEEAKMKINIQGHNQSHPLLRILYNVKGYYQF